MLFWSFIFPETYIYYRSCIYLKPTRGKCAQQLSYGFNILNKLEGWPQEKKNPYGDLDFLNFVPKSIGSSVSENFAKFLVFSENRLKGFLLENWPRKPTWASLARSALEPPWASLARSVPKPSPPRIQIFSSTTSTSCKTQAAGWLWKWSEVMKSDAFLVLYFSWKLYIL